MAINKSELQSFSKDEALKKLVDVFAFLKDVSCSELYLSVVDLNTAFSDNIMWYDADRKKDTIIIFYSLIKLINNKEDLEKLYNLEIFLLYIMPNEWKWNAYGKNLIPDQYLKSYTSCEACAILYCLQYI